MKGTETPEQLISQGFSLHPKCPKNIPRKNQIMEQKFGTDGKLYGKIVRMDKRTQKLFDLHDKQHKAGNGVYFQYEPVKLILNFKYDINVKKDKYGNVTIKISEKKK